MSANKGKKNIPLIRNIIIAGIGVLAILGIAAIIFFFIRYREAVKLHSGASQSLVLIGQPANGSRILAGEPIQVQVNATGQSAFTSVELWINGVLEGVQEVPGEGRTSTTALFWWIPPGGGNYSLVGRAMDEKKWKASSPAVIVFATSMDNGEQPDSEGGKVNPAVLPAPPEEYSNPEPPSDDGAPADGWQASPGNWLNSLTTDSPPDAPELAVTAEGCNIKLDIHDQSENEEGFGVYRQTTNSQEWVHVTDLASHAGMGWIEYQDQDLSGGVTYYISAFNSQGETSSNLALANIDPGVCPPPEPPDKLPVLYLKVKNLSIAGNNARIYCYSSLASGQWSRWPESGFIMGDENEHDVPLLVNPLIVAALDDAGIHPGPQTLDLKLECWGWEGGKLRRLGSFMETLDLTSPKDLHVAITGAAFDISPDLIPGAKMEIFELGGSILPLISGDEYITYDVEDLGYMPESTQMPRIHAYISYDFTDCYHSIKLGELKAQELCLPLPGFDSGGYGVNPQPYLIWKVIDNVCSPRPEGFPCLPLDWWKGFAEANPDPYDPGVQWYLDYSIFYGEDNPSGSESWPYDIRQQAWRIDPDFPTDSEYLCSHGFEYISVFLVARTSYGDIISPKSTQVAVPCPQPKPDQVDIQVTWNTFTLNNIDDGYYWDLTEDHTAEAYGVFSTYIDKYGVRALALQMGYSTVVEGSVVPPGVDQYYELDDGTYNIADFRLALVQYLMNECQDSSCYAFNNNIVTYTVHEYDTLILHVAMWDYDEHSDHDNICFGQVNIGPRSIYDWAKTANEHYDLIYPEGMGDASCDVSVTVNALPQGP